MPPKIHWTLQSRTSGSRWVITPWLSRSSRRILYNSSVYSCHFFLISSVFVRSSMFLSFIMPIHLCIKYPLISPIFWKRSLVFPILLFSFISLHCLLKNAFLYLLHILWNSAFNWIYLSLSPLPFTSLLFSAICKASSDHHFAFLHFFFIGMVLINTSCTILGTSTHSSSGILSTRTNPWIYSSPPLYNHKGFYLGQAWMA